VKSIFLQVYRYLCGAVVFAFVVGGVALGLLFPPFQVADEDLHWLNAVDKVERTFNFIRPHEFSDCKATTAVAYLFNVGPTKSNTTVKPSQNEFNRVGESNSACAKHTEIPSGTTIGYTGVLLARLLVKDELLSGQAALLCFYLSRLLQGLMIVTVLFRLGQNVWRAPSIVPGVLSVLTFALSPMFINQSFGVTYDTVTLALALSCINMILFWNRATVVDHTLCLYFMLAGAISKPVFYPFVLAVVGFLFIVALFRRWRDKLPLFAPRAYLCSPWPYLYCAVIVAVACMIWHVSSVRFVSADGVDPAFNKAYLTEDLSRAFQILWSSSIPRISFNSLASPLGWTNVFVSRSTIDWWMSLVWTALAVDGALLLFSTVDVFRIAGLRRTVTVGVSLLPFLLPLVVGVMMIVVLSAYSMYVLWTPKESSGVVGLQNRYFLTIFPLLFSLLPALLVTTREIVMGDSDKKNSLSAFSLLGAVGALGCLAITLPYIVSLTIDVMSRFH
jgi:uncharacterized membrane protein